MAAGVDFALIGGYTPPAAAAVDFALGLAAPAPQASALHHTVRGPWARAERRDRRVDTPFRAYRRADHVTAGAWDALQRVAGNTATRWGLPAQRQRAIAAGWERTRQRLAGDVRAPWTQLAVRDRLQAAPWDDSITLRAASPELAWLSPPAKDRAQSQPWHRVDVFGTPYPPPAVYSPPGQGDVITFDLVSGYEPPAGAVDFSLRDPPPGRPDQPRDSGAALTYRLPPRKDAADRLPWAPGGRRDDDTRLPYPQEIEPKPAAPPPYIAEVYSLMPTIECTRLDGLPIIVNAAHITGDLDSYAWQLRLVPARREDLAAMLPTSDGPREIEVRVNGWTWTALVEAYDRSQQFGAAPGLSVTAISRSAELGERYAPRRSLVAEALRSAQQLATDELLNTGWTLEWEIPDWLVPAGVWSYQELAPLQAVAAIAEAAGAVVQTDRATKTLRVISRYPVNPWAWASTTPDAILPRSQIVGLSGRWSPAPAYNSVYVAGQQQGVLVHARRMGTAGELVAPMVLHPLNTAIEVGTERGRVELSRSGARELVSLQAPLLPDPEAPGLILPGKLLEVREDTTWRGLVVGTSISATRQNATTVRQAIEVERYHG